MTRRWFTAPALLALALVMVASLMVGGSRIMAQDASPEATPNPGGMTGGDTPRPAHIHAGTCETLGEVVAPLNDLQESFVGEAPGATPTDFLASSPAADIDTGMGYQQSSATVVQLALNDILAAEHAINVHESAENIQNYIACGNITGTPENNELTIQLAELNDSGFSGQAVLLGNGDGTTTVVVTITQIGGDMASPMASPTS